MPKRRGSKRPIKYYSSKRRAVYERGDQIDHYTLFNLHGWTCCICRKQINPRLRLPNWMAATIEHRIPISRGGTHTWDNTFPAHFKCNMDKGDSLLGDYSDIMIA